MERFRPPREDAAPHSMNWPCVLLVLEQLIQFSARIAGSDRQFVIEKRRARFGFTSTARLTSSLLWALDQAALALGVSSRRMPELGKIPTRKTVSRTFSTSRDFIGFEPPKNSAPQRYLHAG